MKMKHCFGLFFSFSFLIFSNPLFAASFTRPFLSRSTEPLVVSQKLDYGFQDGVQSQAGEFSVARAGVNLKKQYKVKDVLPVEFSFALEHYMIHDDTSVDLPASLESKGASLGTKFPMPFVEDDRFFIGLDAGPYFQTAKNHDVDSDAFRFHSRVYGIYRDKKQGRLILAAGMMVYSGYEDRAILPFAGFQYAINDRWDLNFLSNEPFVAYHINEKTTWKWKFGGYHDEFEVISGARKGDVVKIDEFHTGMGIEHSISDDIRFEVSGGWAFNRKYEYLKGGGKVVPDNGVFIGYTLRAEF